jgi:hypothetical protein
LKTYEIILKNTQEHPLANNLFTLVYLAVQVIKLLKENLHLHTYKVIIMILKDVYIIETVKNGRNIDYIEMSLNIKF